MREQVDERASDDPGVYGAPVVESLRREARELVDASAEFERLRDDLRRFVRSVKDVGRGVLATSPVMVLAFMEDLEARKWVCEWALRHPNDQVHALMSEHAAWIEGLKAQGILDGRSNTDEHIQPRESADVVQEHEHPHDDDRHTNSHDQLTTLVTSAWDPWNQTTEMEKQPTAQRYDFSRSTGRTLGSSSALKANPSSSVPKWSRTSTRAQPGAAPASASESQPSSRADRAFRERLEDERQLKKSKQKWEEAKRQRTKADMASQMEEARKERAARARQRNMDEESQRIHETQDTPDQTATEELQGENEAPVGAITQELDDVALNAQDCGKKVVEDEQDEEKGGVEEELSS